jgi:dihydroxy-acid dehydratase
LDVNQRTITLKVNEEEIAQRRAAWKKPALNAKKGLLFKFAQRTTTAAQGCVTDALQESKN